MKKTGVIILLIGLFTTLLIVFTRTMREEIREFMKPEIAKDFEYTVNWRLYTGIGMIVIGGIVFVLGMNKKDEKEILKKMAEELPNIALPKNFVVFDELPKMGSGKIDFRAITDKVRDIVQAL